MSATEGAPAPAPAREREGLIDGLRVRLRTGLAILLLPAGLFFLSLAVIVTALLGGTPRAVHRLYVAAGRMCVLVGGTRLLVRGEEHLEPGQAYVVVSNHESNWDPVCIVYGLRRLVLRAVAKRQFMDIPVLGQALRLSGNVRVVRNETARDKAQIREIMDERHPEVSILFYAEGTRTRDGSLGPFKMGAFATALAYGLPVLPIAVAGARAIWEPESILIRKGTMTIEIGRPIPVEGLGHEDRQALRDRTFEAVRALRTRARERLRALDVEPGGVD